MLHLSLLQNLLREANPIPNQLLLSDDRHRRGAPLLPPQMGLLTPPEPERPNVAHADIRAGRPRRERQAERLGDDAAARLRQCRMGSTLRRYHIPRARRLRHRRHVLPQVVFVLRLGVHRHPERSSHCGDCIHHCLVCHGERASTTSNQVGPQATDKRIVSGLLAALHQQHQYQGACVQLRTRSVQL